MSLFPALPDAGGQPGPMCAYLAATANVVSRLFVIAGSRARDGEPIHSHLAAVALGVSNIRFVLDGGISRPWSSNGIAKTPAISGPGGRFAGERRSLVVIQHAVTHAGHLLAGISAPVEPELERARRHLIAASRTAYSLALEYCPANHDTPPAQREPFLTVAWRYALDTRDVARLEGEAYAA